MQSRMTSHFKASSNDFNYGENKAISPVKCKFYLYYNKCQE